VTEIIEIALFTGKVAEHTDFYRRLLGRSPDVEVGGMSEFHLGGVTLRIHDSANSPAVRRRSAGSSAPPDEDHIAFGVEDLDAATDSAIERGLVFEVGPADFDWGRSAYVRDPDGRLVELSHLRT
jgi:catechol 2,3-dioxygenase-like lactoylglutathione lyase family enzyme